MAKKKKGGLGRGLNSLLGEAAIEPMEKAPESGESSDAPSTRFADEPQSPGQAKPYVEEDDQVRIVGVVSREREIKEITEAPLEDIFPNPEQPRTLFNKEEIEELAASIERDGLLQPILVHEVEGKYQIIAGERRWQACKSLNLERVPVRVIEVNEDKVIELAMVENIQRSDLNPIEEAYGYKRMMEKNGMTQTEVAQAVSKGRSTVANALRLLELPEDAQKLLFEEKITAGHARAILSVQSDEGRAALTEKLKEEKISVREAEAIARLMNGREKANEAKASAAPMPAFYKSTAKNLKKHLGTNVRIKSSKGKNKIEIEFKDEDDLRRLIQSISGEEG